MQNLLLIVAVAAAFVFGWFLMKRLDRFLANNCQTQTLFLSSSENRLRIGFSNPLVADSLATALEKYSKIQPDISVCLFSGAENELMKGLSAHKLDVVFLPENAAILEKAHYNIRKVLLNHTPVIMKYGGFSIEPIADGQILQKVIWSSPGITPVVCSFIECFKDGIAAPELQK